MFEWFAVAAKPDAAFDVATPLLVAIFPPRRVLAALSVWIDATPTAPAAIVEVLLLLFLLLFVAVLELICWIGRRCICGESVMWDVLFAAAASAIVVLIAVVVVVVVGSITVAASAITLPPMLLAESERAYVFDSKRCMTIPAFSFCG